jgi:hypothetical protein
MKGAFMNRRLLVLALGAVVLPAHSMTANVTNAQAPTNAANVPAGATASKAAPAATSGKIVMPSTATVTQPVTVLSAPGTPARANAATAARAGSAKGAKPFMPAAGAQDGTVQSPPAKLATAAIANDSAGMRRGTLEAVNTSAGTFNVYGQKLNFNAQKVRVFNRDGKPGSVFNLKSGTKVRFTLDASDPQRRRVAVIYVD